MFSGVGDIIATDTDDLGRPHGSQQANGFERQRGILAVKLMQWIPIDNPYGIFENPTILGQVIPG